MFTIVTHYAPDLDAITSVWLIKRFLPNWQDAHITFVPAGKTLNNGIVDSDPHILHVDTGFGMLDHHQTDENTCATQKTYKYLREKFNKSNTRATKAINRNSKNSLGVLAIPPPRWEGRWEGRDETLDRMCDVVNFYDHFGEAKLTDAAADYHVFDIVGILDGLKQLYPDQDLRIVDLGFTLLDGLYKTLKEKVWAEEIIDQEAQYFNSRWGKGVGFETLNDAVLKVAQKNGYVVVVRKDPQKGYVRIKGMPDTEVDFTSAYEKLMKRDTQATWFLHSSKKILLNGTTKNPDMKPTKLSLNEIIEVLKGKPSTSLRH